MKLTVDAVAMMTGLAESTVRQYAWKMKLGKVEGRQKVFTISEAKKLGGLKNAIERKTTKKPITKKRKATVKVNKAPDKKVAAKKEVKAPVGKKKSFWSFLGIEKK